MGVLTLRSIVLYHTQAQLSPSPLFCGDTTKPSAPRSTYHKDETFCTGEKHFRLAR